jgi:hypothetical protein
MLVVFRAQGQESEQKVFEIVPEAARARLVERLKMYVEYQRAKDYEKFYDLLSASTIAGVYKGQSRAEFAAAFQRGDAEKTSVRVLEFTPENIEKDTKDEVEVYNIYGTAKLCQQGETVRKQIVVAAQLQDEEWYFSTIADVLEN